MTLHEAILDSEQAALDTVSGSSPSQLDTIKAADGYRGVAPIHLAVKENQFETITRLIDAGADLEIRDLEHAASPLGWAAFFTLPEMVNHLLDQGADIDHPCSPLAIAESGANGDWTSYSDISPERYPPIVALLKSRGAQPTLPSE
jgi:ankyrin repeat protein